MMAIDYLARVRLRDICGVLPCPDDVLDWFSLLGAGWVHNGDPKKPHALLHSGKHSNGFFLCKKVLKHGNLREILAECLIRKLHKAGMRAVHGVFGSPYSSILFAGDVGRLLGVPTYVPEKDPKDPEGKRMVFKPDDPIPSDAYLLQIEELITTSASTEATKQAIILGNPNMVKFSDFVGALVYRPSKIERILPDGREIGAFIEKQVDAWAPEDCPLCPESPVLLPKSQWAELTA